MELRLLITNIIANYFGRVWAIVSIYIFIPLYIKYLGIESYGVIAFYSTLIGILSLADFGLTSTFTRELAQSDAIRNLAYKRSLFKTIEILYLFIVAIIFLIFFSFSDFFSSTWLKSEIISPEIRIRALQLMGIAGGFQLLSSFYLGGLIGLEKQVLANSTQFLWSFMRATGSVGVLLYSPTIQSFLLWQIFSNIVYVIVLRFLVTKQLSDAGRIDFSTLKSLHRFTSGMIVISLLSMLNLQIDKLLVASMTDVRLFGLYTIAATLAQAPLILTSPISYALLPRFTNLFSKGNKEELWWLYRRTGFFVAACVIPISITLAFFSEELLTFWTGDRALSASIKVASTWLILGSMFLSLQVTPFNLAIAHGYTKVNILLGVAFFILLTSLLLIFIPKYQLEGAAISWFVCNMLLTVPYFILIHKQLLPNVPPYFLLQTMAPILIISIASLAIARLWLVSNMPFPLLLLVLIIINGLLFTVSVLIFFRKSPKNIFEEIKRMLL